MRLRTILSAAGLAAASAAGAQTVELNVISKVQVQDAGNEVVVSIKGSKPPNFTTFSMMDPPRFVIDVSESTFKNVPEDITGGGGLIQVVKNLSYGSEATSIARVMIAFTREVDPPDVQTAGSELVVRIAKPGDMGVAQRAAPPEPRAAPAATAAAPAAQPPADAAALAAAEQARLEKEEQARFEAKARAEAEAQAKAEVEAELRAAAEAQALARAQEQQDKARAADEAKARREAEAQAAALEKTDAKARAEEAKRLEEEEAKARREAEAQAKADAKARAEEEKRLKAEEVTARREAEAQAKADAKARAEEEKRLKAEEAKARREAEAQAKADARARAEEAKRLKAEEARARREAGALKVASLPPAEPRVEALAPSGAPNQVREVGFRQMPGASRVFVRTAQEPRFTIMEAGEKLIRVELANTRVRRRNDSRFMDTSFFPSAVALVTPKREGSSYVVEIKLKERVPYQQKVEGDMLAIDFERPAGLAVPPGQAAPGEPAPGEPAPGEPTPREPAPGEPPPPGGND
ncbi:MAG TPA: AMIN domain-containing protein [Anaeromyxobacteraceae bacterium]|nr:AMIN domain-containing protein [Anaeromyxobacteraceae bacterium]